MPIAAQSAGGGSYLPLLLIILLFAVMYFLMIRPQQRRRREAQQMQSSLSTGDEIVTIGGLYATIVDADDETITVEIAPGVHTRYARGAVARVLTSAAVADEIESPVRSEKAE